MTITEDFVDQCLVDQNMTRSSEFTPVLPSGTTVIDDKAFHGCSSMKYIRMESCIENIGISAFCNCTSLCDFNGQYFKKLGNNALEFCTALSSIALDNALSIGNNAFKDCSNCLSIDLRRNQNFSKESESEYRTSWGVPSQATVLFYDN